MAKLSLQAIANQPHLFEKDSQHGIFRPLKPTDTNALAQFLQGLSTQTRYFSEYPSYDIVTANEYCDAIGRYDKLRFVLDADDKQIIGLFEFSFFITQDDRERYISYGIILDSETDCRFGLCLADHKQNHGIATHIFPYILDVALQFAQKRIILWGGVLAENSRAIRYYQKNSFRYMGKFINSNNLECLDMLLEI